MKFVILSGAYINAGDYLIVQRTKELIKNKFPKCELKIYNRNEDLSDKLEEINKSDGLIIAGGPAYTAEMYPKTIKLVENLNEIKTKIYTIGVGWYGKNTTAKFMYNYKFNNKTKLLLDRISRDSYNLACRDFYTVQSLYINGYKNTIMTGCPAWYNLNYINLIDFRKQSNTIKEICISDPAKKENFVSVIRLVNFLKRKYDNPKINFVLHRNEGNTYQKLIQKLKKMDVNIVDITGGYEGFEVYNNCDLHIGFRVHAHIYNLSIRNRSILIEEDGRGAGVNSSLGLINIKAYIDKNHSTYKSNIISKIIREIEKILFRKGKYSVNKNLINDIDNYLNILENNNYSHIKIAFRNMKYYYKNMEKQLDCLKKEDEK